MSNIKDQVSEILTANGLDFTIDKLPLSVHVPNEDGGATEVTEYYGLRNSKTGEVINSVKGSYTVSQNSDIVESIVRGIQPFGELSVNSAGSFQGGRKVYMKLAIDGVAKVGDDTVKRFISIVDSNDGSSSLMVGVGDFTMSCKNQFYRFAEDSKGRFRHTKTIEEKIATIPMLIENALKDSMRMIELYNKFASSPVSKELAHKMVNHLIGFDRTMKADEMEGVSSRVTNSMDMLYKHINKEMEQKGNTLWGLHSGVTSWTTHDKSAPRAENGRLQSSMVGTNSKTNQKSLEFAEMIMG